MSDAAHPSQELPTPRRREFEDPHYHDEEPEIQNDDLPRQSINAVVRRRVARIPQPKRRFYED